MKKGSVYLVNENTAILYTIITPPPITSPNSTKNIATPSEKNSESCKLTFKRQKYVPMKTIIVFLDFFDSITEKREFFEAISLNCPYTTFILINLPGQPYAAYNPNDSLNNVFYKNCLDYLFYYLEEIGKTTLTFDPFGIIAFGNGANIALYWGIFIKTMKY